MRKSMLQLWSDLEAAAEGMGVTWKVINTKVTDRDPIFDASNLVDFQGNGPHAIRANSTYYGSRRHIVMNFPPDFTPAYKAGTFAHELGHHIDHVIERNELDQYARLGPTTREASEVRASLRAYELLYSLTKGRVPLGCVDMLNISLASYVGKEEQL